MDAWHSMGDWGWAMMAFWILLWLALVGLVIWAIAERAGRGSTPSRERESPQEILDRRLAIGEIGLEEYECAREALARRHEAPAG